MRLLHGLNLPKAAYTASVVTIGNFDGFHRGHQAVIDRLCVTAQALRFPAVVIIFEPLPQEFFAPDHAPGRLQRLRDRLQVFKTARIDALWVMPFNAALAQRTAQDFIRHILVDARRAKHVLVGDDFRFGKDRVGDFAVLEKAGKHYGFSVAATPTVSDHQGRISSTRVRAAAQAGDFQLVTELLGRAYSISGRVAHGDKRGRIFGFPTANVRLGLRPHALRGVFAGWLHDPQARVWPAVANIGWRPTLAGTEQRLEAHILDAQLDLYGQCVRFVPVAKIRDEQRFASVEDLQRQIEQDVLATRGVLSVSEGVRD